MRFARRIPRECARRAAEERVWLSFPSAASSDWTGAAERSAQGEIAGKRKALDGCHQAFIERPEGVPATTTVARFAVEHISVYLYVTIC
jgi:hypothetical protein